MSSLSESLSEGAVLHSAQFLQTSLCISMTHAHVRIVGGESSWDRCEEDLLEEVQFLVCDQAGKKVLVNTTEKRYRLPGWFSDTAYYRNLDCMNAAVEDLFGSRYKFTVLQCIWQGQRRLELDDDFHVLERSIVTLECQEDMNPAPEGFEWVSISAADIIHSEKDAVHAIKQEFDLGMTGGSEFRVPWSNMGWYSHATQWMRTELGALDIDISENVVQLRASPWGTVLRGEAGIGQFYLKAGPWYCNEAAISLILSEVAPIQVQRPVVVDVRRNMFISSDYGETPKNIDSSTSDLAQLAKDLASLQKASVTKIDELVEAGVPVYRPGWAAEHLDELYEHKELSFMEDMSVRQELREYKETIRSALIDLDELTYGIPMTFVHGDLGENNVYRRGDGSGGFGFFDWDCAFIGLPFFDITDWSDNAEVAEPYLEEWLEYQSMDNLREALVLGRAMVHVFKSFRALYDLEYMEECCKQYCRLYLFRALETVTREMDHFISCKRRTMGYTTNDAAMLKT